jgi:phosphoglycolate phosphatase-like HAD superfamily hydrolase
MHLRGVILNLDGTLLDSNDAHTRVWVEVLAACGYPVPFDRIRRMIGMGSDKILENVAGLSKEEETGREISRRCSELFLTRYLPQLRPFPRSRELLARI